MLLKIKNKVFADLQRFPRLYEDLNISRIKILLVTPKTTKSTKIFHLEMFSLYGSRSPCNTIPVYLPTQWL